MLEPHDPAASLRLRGTWSPSGVPVCLLLLHEQWSNPAPLVTPSVQLRASLPPSRAGRTQWLTCGQGGAPSPRALPPRCQSQSTDGNFISHQRTGSLEKRQRGSTPPPHTKAHSSPIHRAPSAQLRSQDHDSAAKRKRLLVPATLQANLEGSRTAQEARLKDCTKRSYSRTFWKS